MKIASKNGVKFVAVLSLFMVTHFQSAAGTLEVCQTCPYTNILDALKHSHDGDTILVSPGILETDKIVIDKPIILIGIDYPEIVSKNGEEIITVISSGVTISGFLFRGVTISYLEERSAIRIKRKSNFTISNNKIYDCFFGIYLERASKGRVSNNEIISESVEEASSGNAIHAWNCKNLLIKDNTLIGNRDGIYFEFVDSSMVEGNHSEGNLRYGLHFMFSNDDIYQKNTFIANGAGVAVMFSKRIDMFHNRFADNWGRSSYGLLLKEIYDARISNNTFINNTLGIYIEGSSRILYSFNHFEKNGWALKFAGGSIDNEVLHNNFVNNTLDIMLGTSFANNTIRSNYWSDYSGYDLDRDGVGDVPHYPVKLFAYIIDKSSESVLLLRSLFIDLLNYSEKVSPIFTPKNIQDPKPQMNAYR